MNLKINHELLWDSPFPEDGKGLMIGVNREYDNLLNDLKNGNPTCYLLSGYRGAGKSSFIRKLDLKIRHQDTPAEGTAGDRGDTKQANKEEAGPETIFIYTNFSKYHPQTYLLRKLIRGLYLKVKDLESYKNQKREETHSPLAQRPCHLLETLYEKTFFDTTSNTTDTRKTERITTLNIDLLSLGYLLLGGISFLFVVLNTIFQWFDGKWLFNILAISITFIYSVKRYFKITHDLKKTRSQQEDFNRKSLYDDEIADYHFYYLLGAFRKYYKVVFVMDELDKVDDEEIDKLLKEMKPYLVSGLASFIVVAGQDLYYKYITSKSQDDALLSSIFSKCIHIPLLSREEFRELFMGILVMDKEPTPDEKKDIDGYCDSIIFHSKRIPRKFISLIRDRLSWNNGAATLEIGAAGDYQTYTRLLDAIDDIDEKEIAPEGFDEALRDFFVMQLLLRSYEMVFSKKKEFSVTEILKKNEQGNSI